MTATLFDEFSGNALSPSMGNATVPWISGGPEQFAKDAGPKLAGEILTHTRVPNLLRRF
jgi:hypothetical protein